MPISISETFEKIQSSSEFKELMTNHAVVNVSVRSDLRVAFLLDASRNDHEEAFTIAVFWLSKDGIVLNNIESYRIKLHKAVIVFTAWQFEVHL